MEKKKNKTKKPLFFSKLNLGLVKKENYKFTAKLLVDLVVW